MTKIKKSRRIRVNEKKKFFSLGSRDDSDKDYLYEEMHIVMKFIFFCVFAMKKLNMTFI